MPTITINIDTDVQKIIAKRAKKNMLTVKEQVEEIVRQSAVRTKYGITGSALKTDDSLVSVFSRDKRGNKKK